MTLALKPRPKKRARKIVFVSFETEFSPFGGLTAVMKILPKMMTRFETNGCFTIAPYFRNITRCREHLFLEVRDTGLRLQIPFDGVGHEASLYVHTDSKGFETFLVYSPSFFQSPCDCGNPPAPEAPCNPYWDPSKPEQLLQDALFFCAAVPKVLVALKRTQNLVVHLQDWQSSLAVFTLRQEPAIGSCSCLLTLHNPYDTVIDDYQFRKICDEPVFHGTALTRAIPFMDGPLSTVSENFGQELTGEVLHTEVYAPHLQEFFRSKGLIGVNNGSFLEHDFPQELLNAADQGDLEPLHEEKRKRRKRLDKSLLNSPLSGAWGRLDLEGYEGPIFFMFGRDDPRQKGYDLAAAAVYRMEPRSARFIFAPIPGEEQLEGLNFLNKLATEHRVGEVLVFPYRVEPELYGNLLQGASFLFMPSLYEPFGGSTEGYASGTPVVARATGGLVQQVVPRRGKSFSHAVSWRASRFHGPSAPSTGFLFREPDMEPWETTAGWRGIVECSYQRQTPRGSRVQDRLRFRLFDGMVQEAAWTLQEAIEIYERYPMTYVRMIRNGIAMLENFPWERSVRDYQRLYDMVTDI